MQSVNPKYEIIAYVRIPALIDGDTGMSMCTFVVNGNRFHEIIKRYKNFPGRISFTIIKADSKEMATMIESHPEIEDPILPEVNSRLSVRIPAVSTTVLLEDVMNYLDREKQTTVQPQGDMFLLVISHVLDHEEYFLQFPVDSHTLAGDQRANVLKSLRRACACGHKRDGLID